jgi:hypothetical protein
MLISEKSPLIFMHIPKTGGMSLFSAFCGIWGTRIADMYNVTVADPAPAARMIEDHGYCLYCGHFPFGLHEWFDRPTYYASVVRQPVERIVSLYYYSLVYREKVRKLMASKGISFEQVFDQPDYPDYYRDFPDWIQADELDPELFLSSACADLDNGMVRRFSGVGLAPGPCPAEALEQAKENIRRHFSAVGVLERYPETLDLLARKLNLPKLTENRVNVGPKSRENKTLPDPILKRIEAMNALDIELYRWVNERFDEELAQPRSAVALPGGNRTDWDQLKLWRAVGTSPIREASMKLMGVPPRMPRPAPPAAKVLNANLSRVKLLPKQVLVEFAAKPPGQAGQPAPHTRIALDPVAAKRLAITLSRAVREYEQANGVIAPPGAARPGA